MATAAAVGLASTAIVAAGGGSAAAASLPNAQAVGRLADGALGGMPIQSIADVQDARATAPGTTSSQNPLTATLLNQLKLPLDNVIQIPTNPAVDAGVVNQVAKANLNGASNGAAGAVADDGGASLGDDNDGTPAFATVDLTDAAVGSIPIPGVPAVPGLPAVDPSRAGALGGVTASLGAVYSSVGTEKGGKVITPSSGITNVKLNIGSPALGALLTQLKGLLGGADLADIPGLGVLLGNVTLPSGCALSDTVPNDIDFKNGVVIDVENASISVDLEKLIAKVLGKDISNLNTSNFDLISFLVENLPTILSEGLSGLVTGITTELATQFENCIDTLPGGLAPVLTQVTNALLGGQTQITTAINGIAAQFNSAGDTGLSTLADGLKNLVDIGLNVQSGPGIEPRDSDYPFESNLAATPNQSTDVVKNQTLVRAIEIQVLDVSAVPGGLGGIPTLPGGLGGNSSKVKQLAGSRPLAKAPGDGAINLALANAAAGPSNAPDDDETSAPPSSSTPPTVVPTTNIPTGIPAGQAAGSHDDGLPVLPLVAILMLLTVSGGAFWQYRMRGLHQG